MAVEADDLPEGRAVRPARRLDHKPKGQMLAIRFEAIGTSNV